MYREHDFEMKRLLESIGRIARSRLLVEAEVEAHLFMDNGAKGRDVQVRGTVITTRVHETSLSAPMGGWVQAASHTDWNRDFLSTDYLCFDMLAWVRGYLHEYVLACVPTCVSVWAVVRARVAASLYVRFFFF